MGFISKVKKKIRNKSKLPTLRYILYYIIVPQKEEKKILKDIKRAPSPAYDYEWYTHSFSLRIFYYLL